MQYNQTELISLQNLHKPYLVIYGVKEVLYIAVQDILYVQADDHYAIFFTKQGKKYVSSKTLGHYETLLNQEGFIRIHRSYLVNSSKIKTYCFYERTITLHNNVQLWVSHRKHKSFVTEMYGDYQKVKALAS